MYIELTWLKRSSCPQFNDTRLGYILISSNTTLVPVVGFGILHRRIRVIATFEMSETPIPNNDDLSQQHALLAGYRLIGESCS